MSGDLSRSSGSSEGMLDSFLFRFGTRLLMGLGVIVIILTLTHCTVKKPESPQWNTQLTIPVVNRIYTMDELIGKIDQDGVGIDSAGNITFSVTEELDTVRLDEDMLTTSNLSYSVSEQLGIVSIDPPAVDPVSVSLASISGLASSLPGDSAAVVATSFDLFNDMPTITEFSSATITSGQVNIDVDNNLGIDLDTVIVQLYDVGNAVIVAIDTFPGGIAGGVSAQLPIVLDGTTVSNSLRVISHIHTPSGIIDSASTRYISTGLSFSDSLQVSSAMAEIPALSRSFTQQVLLGETDRIDSATLAAGNLSMTIVNATNLTASVTVSIPDVISATGDSLTVVRSVAARQNLVITQDLAGYRLVPTDISVPQGLDINVDATAPGTAPQHVQVSQSDSFHVEASLISLAFSSVSGVFDSVSAGFADIGQDIEVPSGLDSVQFVTAVLTLEIENGVDLPGSLDIQITGNNGKNLSFTGAVAAGGSSSTITRLSDSTVADFLSPIPSHIDVSGSIVMGDGAYAVTVNADDFVLGRVRIEAPLEMVIPRTQVETDIESEKIDQNDIDVITDHFISGRFVYNIINHLPLGAYVNVFFAGDSASVYTDPLKTFDSLYITAAPVSASGIVTDTAATGYQEIYIDSADVRRLLANDTLFIGQELILEGSGGQPVKLMQNDYVTVIGRFEIEYLFDGEF
ncbi:MAG: hypothetical protein ABII79_10070 [bacterium]